MIVLLPAEYDATRKAFCSYVFKLDDRRGPGSLALTDERSSAFFVVVSFQNINE